MGIAILNIMLQHFIHWNELSSPQWMLSGFRMIYSMVYTEGFLFLSGFGLYYSFTKSPKIKGFYKRRFVRLIIPFVIIALPFLLIDVAEGKYGLDIFTLRISTLYFWVVGNDGLWYISLSVILYLLFPLLYKPASHWGGTFACLIADSVVASSD